MVNPAQKRRTERSEAAQINFPTCRVCSVRLCHPNKWPLRSRMGQSFWVCFLSSLLKEDVYGAGLRRMLHFVAIATAGSKTAGGRANTCAADYHNCFASRRCCNPGSKCYTKAVGVRFAQCRPNGCVGTCGWECRVHSHASSSALFGANAQNTSQAIAAMKQPLILAAGMLPKGRSERLGNIIDSCPLPWLEDTSCQILR